MLSVVIREQAQQVKAQAKYLSSMGRVFLATFTENPPTRAYTTTISRMDLNCTSILDSRSGSNSEGEEDWTLSEKTAKRIVGLLGILAVFLLYAFLVNLMTHVTLRPRENLETNMRARRRSHGV